MKLALRTIPLLVVAALAAVALAACGGDSGDDTSGDTNAETVATDSTSTESGASASSDVSSEPVETTPSVSDSCSDVETFDVPMAGDHFDKKFTFADYSTNPPVAGDHNPTPIETGQFYSSPPEVGEVVHALEHGAVIGWTNGLSPDDQKAVEDAFNEEFSKGYYQLAVVEEPDLEGTFAMSSWDSLQRCDSPDPAAISDFIENHYAPDTTAEQLLACTGKAARLPACQGA